ncbi:MAG: NAD(+)/NADH kinase [Deltaproteobacteria bacterium]|nr:NAD(+)/NADH kinase [Deltaproteobacteria bacterium]
MARRRTILVVYKKSAFQLYALERKEPKVRALMRRGSVQTRIMAQSHLEHAASLQAVLGACRATGADVREVYRAHLRSTSHADLVVTVGGDGTLLDASHRVARTPLLGVNSNPTRSVGFLTGATAATFADVLEGVLARTLRPLRLLRLDVAINGRSLGVPVLNDVLFCHVNPAATSRYTLQLGRAREEQKSSGAWVATAAGSTAAVLSAGGQRDDMEARRFQYRVREPYAPPGTVVHHVGGFVGSHGLLRFISGMREGAVFVDGSHLRFPVGMGDVLTLSARAPALYLVRPGR